MVVEVAEVYIVEVEMVEVYIGEVEMVEVGWWL